MAMDWVGGKRMTEWLPIALDKFEKFAKDCGCGTFRRLRKNSLEKNFKKFNWEPDYIAYRMELNNG